MSLKPHFDAESCKVYFASATGIAATVATANWSAIISSAVGVATFIYICIKIFKQIRDWKQPDKD